MQQLKKEYREHSAIDLAAVCARIALDPKAEDLTVLDMRGRSTRHVQALRPMR
jgi:ribosome-associated protein